MLAARIFDEVATENGLTLTVPETKLLPGIGLTNHDLAPLELDGGIVEVVERFKYLGSLVEACDGVVGKAGCRITQTSWAFGSLLECVFTVSDLTMEIKRMVHRSVGLGVLLYGAETLPFPGIVW